MTDLFCELCGEPLHPDDSMLVGDEAHIANACPACGAFDLALVQAVREIAPQLPTGLGDPQARAKLEAEQAELDEELAAGRRDDALTELADVCYYAGKAVLNDLMPLTEAVATVAIAAARCGVGLAVALDVMQAKYLHRIEYGKDKLGERRAVLATVAQQQGSVL